jgi:hypothetical protein
MKRILPLPLALALACVALAPSGTRALAAPPKTKTARNTCLIPAGTTRTCDLRYPDAKRFARARYAARARLLGPKVLRHGQREPDLRKVKFLFTGSAHGGTVFRVKLRNRNRAGTAAPRVRLVATTTH